MLLLLYSVNVIVRDVELCFLMPFTKKERKETRKKQNQVLHFHVLSLLLSFPPPPFVVLLPPYLSHSDSFQLMSATQTFSCLLFSLLILWNAHFEWLTAVCGVLSHLHASQRRSTSVNSGAELDQPESHDHYQVLEYKSRSLNLMPYPTKALNE